MLETHNNNTHHAVLAFNKKVAYMSMTEANRIIGYVGCSLMSIQGVPQIWRVYKNKSASDLSYLTLALGCIGGGITVAYGVLINEPPIYATVSFTLLMNIIVLVLKIHYQLNNTLLG